MTYSVLGWLLWQLRRWEVRTHHGGRRRFWTKAVADEWAVLGSGRREDWTVEKVPWFRGRAARRKLELGRRIEEIEKERATAADQRKASLNGSS